ncbi:hypothetical protein COE58_24505 [Bacillus cereus]|nr:hypothetical protein COE58_24505 [Bacillus cereus]
MYNTTQKTNKKLYTGSGSNNETIIFNNFNVVNTTNTFDSDSTDQNKFATP